MAHPAGFIRAANGQVSSFGYKQKTAGYDPVFMQLWAQAPSDLRAEPQQLAVAYFANVYAFQCIELRANKIASLPWQVFNATGQPVGQENPVKKALEWAYTYKQQDIFYLWARSRSMYGETFLEPVENFVGDAFALQWINNLAIEVIENTNGTIREFRVDNGGKYVSFEPGELIYERRSNPANDNRGVGRLQMALDGINVNRKVLTYVKAWFDNGAQPGLIFSPKEKTGLTKTDADHLRESIEEDAKGVQNWFEPLVSPIPMDVTIAEAPKLTEQQVLTDDVRDQICNAIGVPRGLVDHNNAKYQLSPQQNYNFLENEIIPEAETISRAFNAQFMPRLYPEGMTFSFDMTDLRTRLDDEKTKTDLLNAQLNAGGITLNEWRRALGFTELPSGNVLYVPGASIQIPPDQLGSLQAKPSYMPYGNPGVTIQQAGFLAQGAGINVPPAPPPETNPASEAPAAVLEQAKSPDATTVTPSGETEVDAQKSTDEGLCVALKLGAQPDLVALQQRVKSLYAEQPVEWNDPADFHITLLYLPVVDDEQVDAAIEAVKALPPSSMSLVVGSLNSFDNVGEHALHFKIRQNAALYAYQEQLYEAVAGIGVQPSAYSVPNAYVPHITMGYATSRPRPITFKSKLNVQPAGLVVWHGDEVVLELDATGDEVEEVIASPDEMRDELNTWQKFALRHGVTKALVFDTHMLTEDIAIKQRQRLASIIIDPSRDDIRSSFDPAFAAVKALDVPDGYLDYWKDYDALQTSLGGAWLNDYMRAAWDTLQGHINAKLDKDDVLKVLADFQPDLEAAWIGTEDKPGAMLQLALAGMAAGQAAIQQGNVANPQKPTTKAAIEIDWAMLSEEAVAFVKQYLPTLIRNINATTVRDVQAAIQAWIESGAPLDDLTKSLEGIFTDSTRAALIAQTESTRAYAEGTMQRYRAAGVETVKISNVNDSHVCPICNDAASKSYPIGAVPTLPLHPGCRCYARAVI